MADPVVTRFVLDLARSEATDLVDVTGGTAVLNRVGAYRQTIGVW